MKKRNLLIVCLSYRDVAKINKLDLSIYSNVVLASDDFKVHKVIQSIDLIDKVIFLQKPIAYTKVSSGVMEMIDKVNIYFNKIIKLGIFSKKELFWTYHVEGGYTTQKLQETLLRVESTHTIFDEYAINELVTLGSNKSLTINIFKRLASKRGFRVTSYNRRNTLDQNNVKDIIRPIYFLLRSLICKITSHKPKYFDNVSMVLFQICGSSSKHINNALFPQDEFLKNGYTPLNIVWGNAKEVKKINDMGYKAIALESYLRFSDFFASLFKLLLVFKKIKTLKQIFYKTNTFVYKGIDVTDIVYGSVLQYLYTDGPENYRYIRAAQRFILEYSKNFVAIKYCGAKFLTQGTIMSEIFKDKYIKFDYEVGHQGPNPYTKKTTEKHYNFFSKNFIKFAANDTEREYLIKYMNISENCAVKFGPGRANSHFEKAKKFSKEYSKKELGIKKNYDIYLLLDFSGVLAGYNSPEEVFYISNTVINFFKDRTDVAVIIKPHPSADLSNLNELLFNANDNIYRLNKNILPDHALNVSDLIICKNTYMGVEAMIYDVQVASVLLDKESIFKLFGKAAEYIYKKNDLTIFLEKNLSSKDRFIEWKDLYQEKRRQFIQKHYSKVERSSEEIIVKTISKHIKKGIN